MPVVSKLGNSVVSMSLRDGFLIIIPLIVVTSIFLLIGNFLIPGWPEFWIKARGPQFPDWLSAVSNLIFSFMGILSAIAIVYAYDRNRGLDPIQSGTVSFISFLILTPISIVLGKKTVSAVEIQSLGPNGTFLGIIIALISVEVYRFTMRRSWTIKMSGGVPLTVAKLSGALIPSALIVVLFFLIRILFSLTSFYTAYNLIHTVLQTPLRYVDTSLLSILLYNLLVSFSWFFSINGPSITNSVWQPISLVSTQDNLKAFRNRVPLPHIYTQPFIDLFTTYDGGGSTLALLIVVFVICKSKRLPELGKLTILPGIFGINEFIILGLSVTLSLVIVIPFVLCPVLNTLTSGIIMNLGWVAWTNGVQLPWTIPPVTFRQLVTGGWTEPAL